MVVLAQPQSTSRITLVAIVLEWLIVATAALRDPRTEPQSAQMHEVKCLRKRDPY